MKLLIGSGITFGGLILGLIAGIMAGGQTGLLALSFCGLAAFGWPLFVLALYRFFNGGGYRIVRTNTVDASNRRAARGRHSDNILGVS